MELQERKISVWVCQEEKLVSGLSRRTTCADVVRVLLEEQGAQEDEGPGGMLTGPAHSYCIVEKWRGFERILPNKTRILRLWSAWGEEQGNVRFVLVKSEASLPNNGPRSAEARVVLSKESPCALRGSAKAVTGLTQDKQRRVVRKAFRKLAKINRKRKETFPKDASSAEKMETLVHLVLSQDHTIRQQLQRILELDREIYRYEAKVHFDRIKRHGVNYVQDTYLVEAGLGGREPEGGGVDGSVEDEECSRRYEELARLQEELSQQEQLVESVATEIQEELNQRWMERRKGELGAKEAEAPSPEPEAGTPEQGGWDSELLLERERLTTQLSTSLYIGLRLNTDLEALKGDLDCSQQVWDCKGEELQRLLHCVDSLDVGGDGDMSHTELREGCTGQGDALTAAEGPGDWAAEGSELCKDGPEGNDEDSDTGLSSMHSQDSDSIPAVCESLV
ncbi:ras association domain-containing protein 10 [Ambystoma mexicanum]|uniref:ras association domain-containing protein 10 n=1 Tax=Ambystoma mexicanum TaxID=8296 RepID=UPI0037E746DD